MVKLIDEDILTREVLEWKGIHLFHYASSSASQKTRIFLNLKQVDWEPHHIDLVSNENYGDWYLGINPRGLVPTLVVDGEVHIESNDIMTELERRFPVPRLIPVGQEREIDALLRDQDDLHLDLATLTFRFVRPYTGPFKSAETLRRYSEGGTGTVRGKSDPNKQREIEFWESVADGISDAAAKTSARRFKDAFNGLEDRLANAKYLLGRDITMADIAWFINANRLALIGYPIERLHPRVHAWFTALREQPEFAKEVERPPEVLAAIRAHQQDLERSGQSLTHIAEFAA